MRLVWIVLLCVGLVALSGCSSFSVTARGSGSVGTTHGRPAPPPADDVADHAVDPKSLGIPPGHIPPPGQCRVWHPGVPPGHQPSPGPCPEVKHEAGRGDWLIYRPSAERKIVRIS
jgi:hypothetical protein